MTELYPDNSESEAADEGTEAHDWADKVLNGIIELCDVPPDFVEGVALYVNDIRESPFLLEAVSYSEFSLRAEKIHKQFFGTSDFVSVAYNNAVIWDFKYGRSPVNAFENWQGIGYAAGVLEAFPNVKEIEIRIVQPRNPHAGQRIQSWVVSRGDLQPYFERMRAAASEALDTAEPRLFAGMHCQYCPARHGCKALDEKALSYVDSAHKADRFDLDPATLACELDELTEAAKIIKYRLTSLQAQAESDIRAGRNVPGWDIVRSKGRLKWDVDPDVVLAIGEMLNKSLSKKSTITPTQAKAAGIPEEMVDSVASRSAGTAKLEKINFKQKFQG